MQTHWVGTWLCIKRVAVASYCQILVADRVDPLARTTDVLTKLVNRWPASRVDGLMPWAYAKRD
jgi:hypothetical protein